MSDHRKPEGAKTGSKKSAGTGKWVAMAVGLLVVLLLLGWLVGSFADNDPGNDAFPDLNEEPDARDEPEVTDDPEVTEDPAIVDEPMTAEEPEFVE